MIIFKRTLCILLAVCMLYSFGYAEEKEQEQQQSREMQLFELLLGFTQMDHFYGSSDEDALRGALTEILKNDPAKLEDALKGAFDTFDPNTRYIKAEDYQSVMETVEGNYVGVGISVSMDNGKIYISSPFPNSPAEAAGLVTGDIITAVDGKDVTKSDINEAIALIRGIEDTTVTITVSRNGELLDYTMERKEIKLNPISFELMEDGIGYVKISSFTSNVEEYLKIALSELEAQKVKTIILDLRNNFGGEVNAALATASHFVPDEKLIMKETFKNKRNDSSYYSTSKTVKFKVVVLINNYSASASEIVAGAIKDHKLGPLVGETSYGKGTVQSVRKVATGGAIWYTIAAYLTPSGEWIHEKGIDPDYYVENVPEKLDTSDIPPLTYSRVMKIGDKGEDVLTLKKNLVALGFDRLIIDDNFDDITAQSVIIAQKAKDLFPYGVADINTQLAISDLLSKATYTPDKQLEKALEIARELK